MKLGIINFSDKLQRLNSSMLFCASCDSKATAINYGLFTLLNNTRNFSYRYLVLDDITQKDIRNNFFAPEEKLSEIKAHVYSNKNKGHMLKWIVSDFKHINALDENSLFVIIVKDTLYKDTKSVQISNILENIKKFAMVNKSTVLLINYGVNQLEINSTLLKNSTSVDGLQSVKKSSINYDLNVFFWTAEDGEVSHGQSELNLTEKGFESIINKEDESYLGNDYQDCFVVGSDFKPDKVLYNRIEQFPDNQSMYETAMKKAISCTCFFNIYSRMDIDKISGMVYRLRLKKGKNLKIFVLDRTNGLRANSAKFLMDCGVNFIFDFNAKSAYINTVLPSLKNLTLKNEIQIDYDTLKDRYYRIEREKNGYLEKKQFIRKVAELISVDNAYEGDGALVLLRPHHKIEIESAVGQFKPKRGGDYCTIADGNVVVFLPSCRNGDLAIGLRHVFNTGYDKLFMSYSAAFTKADIITLLREIDAKEENYSINFSKIKIINEENRLRSEHLTEKEIRDYCMETEWNPQEFDLQELKENA